MSQTVQEPTVQQMIEDWNGTAVIQRHDPSTEAWIFIALHDARLGRPVGGTRLRSYPDRSAALRDAMRLAEGMTYKWAGIDVGLGGGKAVVDLPAPLEGEERELFFRRYGRLLEALSGAFATGVDLGTTPADMDVAAEETRFVFGRPPGSRTTVDPGPFTALGVISSMRAALAASTGSGSLEGRTVLVQGLGGVGLPLARMVAEAGGELIVSDMDEDRARTATDELGARSVAPEAIFDVRCDVFAPCAVGGILNDRSIPALRASTVVGSANNQLEAPRHAAALAERGILYAPDFIVNAGGALAFALLDRGVTDHEEIRSRVRGIGDALDEILRAASDRNEDTLAAAHRRIESRLAARPAIDDAGRDAEPAGVGGV